MTYEFGPFRYDAGQRLLFRGGDLVPLVPKAIETLHVLLERRGSIVEKSELMKLVWPDTHVEDVGLARNISLLRKALEDESEENPYIETIPRRGYRFAAQVSIVEPSNVPPTDPRQPSSRCLRWLIVSVCALVVGPFVYYQFYVPSRYLPKGHRTAGLAVVPFECLCPGMDGDRFSPGFNDVLVADLSKLAGVQVIAPSTVRRHQRMGVSMGLMGRLLGLDVLIEGTVQKLDERLRITARLVDVHTGRVIWAETYDERADDPGGAQEEVGRAVTAEVGKLLVPSNR
ncbi:MAG TPA: winged helix-turn-helix domain-containing protein [Bryobacteraceae bacterium]|nr:winged helix-turn-helix domain-containing protein [Bryobacteraceae bacterium]